MEKVEITRILLEREERVEDYITKEIPLTIYIDDKELVTLLASPDELDELAVGFLYSAGIVTEFSQIEKIYQNAKRWTVSMKLKDGQFDPDLAFRRIFTSGCGRGTLIYKTADLFLRNINSSNISIQRKQIFQLMADFQSRSAGFKATGGVHSAALASAEGILVTREDIGRHNAIDKILGYALINDTDLENKIILSSGRVSSEIVLKIQKTPIAILISRSAPTDQAVKHAEETNITLVGFARARRMNVYSGLHRII